MVNNMIRLAILVIGQMRFLDNGDFSAFIRYFPPQADMFVGTYRESAQVAETLVEIYNKGHYEKNQKQKKFNASDWISYAEDQTVGFIGASNISKDHDHNGVPSTVLQWIHLHQLLYIFNDTLKLNYDIILKVRTDLVFVRGINNIQINEFNHVQPNMVYARSDVSFYAETNTFINVFQDFYPTILTLYLDHNDMFIPLNYTKLKLSDPRALRATDKGIINQLKKNAPKSSQVQQTLGRRKVRSGCVAHTLVYPCRLIKAVKNKNNNVLEALLADAIKEEYCQLYPNMLNKFKNRVMFTPLSSEESLKNEWLLKWNQSTIVDRPPPFTCDYDIVNEKKDHFCNTNASSNKRFGSEKYFLIHVLTRASIQVYQLPFIAVKHTVVHQFSDQELKSLKSISKRRRRHRY